MTEKLITVVKIIRPLNFLITYVSVIVAAIICQPQTTPRLIIFLAAFAASFALASGNILNDIYDIEIDKINRPDRPLPSKKISIIEAYTFYIVLVVISISISIIVSFPAFIVVIVSHLLLFVYSKYLKQIPLTGNILVSFLTGLVFIFGGVVVGNLIAAIVPATFAFMINLIREIVKDMEDVDGDKKAGVITFPIQFGFQKSKILILLITIALILFTLYPFLTKLYNIEYFIVVMVTVNPILVYCLKKIFEDNSLRSLKKISNLLKLSMVFGLVAIYFGI